MITAGKKSTGFSDLKRCAALLFVAVLVITGCQSVSKTNAPLSAPEKQTETIVILHTNDLHSNLLPDENGTGGLANIAAYFKSVKNSRSDVLILDAGDMSVGKRIKPVPLQFYGLPVFDVMNTCGYDAAVLGNHEFDDGPHNIYDYRKEADFPLLSSNLLYNGELIADAPTALIDVNGIKVGIVGVTTEGYFQHGVIDTLPLEETVQKHIDELEPQADLIVGLTHLGCGWDCELACTVTGLDVIVGGHSHTLLCEAIDIADTIIVHAGEYGEHVGRLEITLDPETEEILDARASIIPIPVAGLAADPETQQAIAQWERTVAESEEVVIGRNPYRLEISEVSALIERIWKESFQTDFAFQNPDGTKAPLEAGDITEADIFACMPFQNTLVILTLPRETIVQIISYAAFAEEKAGYTLVTNNYAAEKLMYQYEIPEERVEWTSVNWREPIIEYVKEAW